MSEPEHPAMYVPSMDAIVSRWFTTYEGARASLDAGGGYLLPHQDQYFVTSPEAIRELGLDPDDPDWARIGWDWVRPRDPMARERLRQRRVIAALARRPSSI